MTILPCCFDSTQRLISHSELSEFRITQKSKKSKTLFLLHWLFFMSSEVEKRRLGIEQKQRRPSIQIVANVLRQSQTQQLTSLSLESPAVNLDSVAEDGSAAEAGPANEESSPL